MKLSRVKQLALTTSCLVILGTPALSWATQGHIHAHHPSHSSHIGHSSHTGHIHVPHSGHARVIKLRGPINAHYMQKPRHNAVPQLRRAHAYPVKQPYPVAHNSHIPHHPHGPNDPRPKLFVHSLETREPVRSHKQPQPRQPLPLRRMPAAPISPPAGAPVTFVKTAPNQEADVLRQSLSASPFKISVDGETIAGGGFEYESDQRSTDKALSETNIQIKSDGLDVTPMLNIGIQNDAVSVAIGEPIKFMPYANYSVFIDRGEVRVFSINQSVDDEPLAILPLDKRGHAQMFAHPEMPREIFYQLRVYDSEGRFDETSPRTLTITDQPKLDTFQFSEQDATFSVHGVDRTLTRNINVRGGAVTVYGKDVPEGHRPHVFGRAIPLDPDGAFINQQILPYGDHTVKVAIVNELGQGVFFNRDIHIKDTEFFYVALGDLTLGQRSAVGPADLTPANDKDFKDVVVNGRAAFYLKGTVKGEYLITAAMDTGEERLKDIFSHLDEKDPRQLLRRLESDKFYPVYGDDSYTQEGAPTQGKFYVRVDKDDSHIMWGNFATQITGTEYAQLDRGLYGGIADYNSDNTTSFGERKTEATVFAADPGTIPGRDIFRGTGGSVYFLKRQDISVGSERARIEIWDKDTGRVLETRNLRPYEDYDIDYIQGRILLSEPLQSTVSDGQLVRTGGLSGHEAHLVVRYEYTPGLTDIGGYTVGGRATQWVGDHIRLGVTAQNETTDAADQKLYGADILLRKSNETYLKAEFAQTDGPGFGESASTDGGFIFDDVASPGQAGQTANAYRVEAAASMKDMGLGLRGSIHGAYEHIDDGYSGIGQIRNGEHQRATLGMDLELSRKTKISVEADQVESTRRGDSLAVYADINHDFSDKFSVGAGVRYDEYDDTLVPAGTLSPNRIDRNGSQTDASVEMRYNSNSDITLRAFGQGTIDKDGAREGNNRGGVGADINLGSRMNVSGEISHGDGGLGANAMLTYKRSESSEYYLGYALATSRSDTGFNAEREATRSQGTITAGARKRFSDALSVYGEEQYGYGERGRELTHTYGVDYSPDEKWTLGATVENGLIQDDIDGDFERTAFSVSASRSSEGLRLASNLEGRFEDGVVNGQNRDRVTWLMRNTVAFDAGQNWELLGRLNFAMSDSDQTSFLNSDYVEGVLAAAYRPINNDRINALLKYTYFEDLSPAQQINQAGQNNLARQRSQILSADVIADVSKHLSIGGKIGYRSGEVALDRTVDDFIKSDAYLGVIRADIHVVKKWDLMAEGRVLSSELANDTRYGALVGVYRHIGDNMKLGAGYSFSRFSDDLTDYSNDADGFFVNMVGKF